MPKGAPGYRHHKPSGRAVVTLNGRDHYLGPYGSPESRLKYDELLSQWYANGRRPLGRSTDGRELTIAELVLRYYEHAETYYQGVNGDTGHLPLVRRTLKRLRLEYGEEPASDFGPGKLKALREVWVKEGTKNRATINQMTGIVKRMFKWAVSEEQFVPPSVYQALTAVSILRKFRSEAREPEPVRPVPEEHIEAVIRHLTPELAAMVRLQRLTGMRPGEVCIMRLSNLEMDGESGVLLYWPDHHKNDFRGHQRQVLIGPRGQAVLAPIRGQCPRSPDDYLFRPRGKGSYITEGQYGRRIRMACDAVGVERWAPNRLRHTFATEIRRKFGLEVARSLLGHTGWGTVTERYAEVDTTKAYQAIIALG